MKRCVAVLAVFAWTIADLGAQPGRPEIAFTPDGSVGALREGAGWTNQVRSSNPGRGFLLRTFTGSAIEEIRLDKVQFEGEALRVGRDDRPPRLLFKVHRGLRYLGFRLERVEGVPASSQTSLAFEMNGVDSGLRVLALDYMTRASSVDGAVRVEFNHLWHRRAGDPLGGFALYVASTDEAEDDALAEIWSQEDLPRPVVAEPWTPDRVRRWVDDYHERFKDMTTMILAAGSSAELYQLTAVAERRGVRIVYLHTDTWRGEYWPAKNSHVHVNPQVFPDGRRDLRRYSDHLASRGMHLALHYVCAGIGPEDPRRIQGRVSRDLATWGHGELAESVDARARTLRFRPAPGTEYPLASSPASNAPGVYERIWDTGFVRLGEEIVRVGRWVDVDGPVWTLGDCRRGYGATVAASHEAGTEAAGLLSAYGQVFVPDVNSPLLEEMAREYADFANEIGLDQLEYDAYEIHRQYPWGPRKFSDLVARHLDHPVVSNTSSGVPVPSNLELRFGKVRRLDHFGYHTVNLSFQLDDHRPATSLLDAWFELSSLVAKGVRRFQVLKPEPMFGVSTNILATHGLTDELFSAFGLWREARRHLTGGQMAALRGAFVPFGNHMKGKDLFEVRRSGNDYRIFPIRVMVRREGDVPWLVGQEFGPTGPRQLGRPGERFEVENPFQPQTPGFVLRVLAELRDDPPAPGPGHPPSASSALAEGDRSGADGVVARRTDGAEAANRASAASRRLQPNAAEIGNQRFARFTDDGDGIWIDAENPTDTPRRIEEDLPTWRRSFSMSAGRGLAMDVVGDGSGAVLLVQLSGRGVRDYVVKVDFTGPRRVVIPHGEAAWADGAWGWRFGAKHFDYRQVDSVGMGFGVLPPRSKPRVRISNLRTLVDVPSKLVSPVVRVGAGSLRVHGEIPTGCYVRYTGGTRATVHDRNWQLLREVDVAAEEFLMPSGYAPVSVSVEEGSPRPWLELQTTVTGPAMIVAGN